MGWRADFPESWIGAIKISYKEGGRISRRGDTVYPGMYHGLTPLPLVLRSLCYDM